MKEGWLEIKLTDVCEKITQGPNPKYDKNGDDNYRVLKTKNLYDHGIFYDNADEISKHVFDTCLSSELRNGDVLLAIVGKGSIGKCNVFENKSTKRFIFTRAIGLIRTEQSRLNPHYLKAYLQSKHGKNLIDSGIGGTSGQQVVTTTHIKALNVQLPPLPEQKRIVAILDEAFAGIAQAVAHAEKNLANARELFESYLNDVFTRKGEGWVEKQLSEVCGITSKLVDPREPEYIDLPHLGAGNMVSMTGDLVEIKTAREEGLKSGKFVFDETMVLYSKIRPYLMKVCRPGFTGLCSADVYPLSPSVEWLDRDFLFHLLMSRYFTDYAIAGSDRAGMPKVNRDHLFRYRVYLPNVLQQKQVATKLDELSSEAKRLETLYQKKLTALAELKQSILQKAFAGELH